MIQLLGLIVTLTASAVLYGWWFDVPALTSIMPFWVTMKTTTALCFFNSGVMLMCIEKALTHKHKKSEIVLSMMSMGIFFVVSLLILEVFTGLQTGIGSLFANESQRAVMSLAPGIPSMGTLVAFMSTCMVGFLALFNTVHFYARTKICGFITLGCGLVALAGYLLNIPLLYYYVEGQSTAMAFHTMILFNIIGVATLMLGFKINK